MTQTADEIQKTVTMFESLIGSYRRAGDRLIEKRGTATAPELIADLDHRIAANKKTIEGLERAVDALREQAKIVSL